MVERPTPWEQLDGVKFVLEQILEQAVEWERSRIIKLLEERTNDSGSVLDETGNSIADLSDLIELIKGETK
jgi:hypothetical protein